MANILEMLQEIRDTLNTNNDPITQYPVSHYGLLQNIRDLLGGDGVGYKENVNGLLEEIRDLLNTGNASVASYPPGQYGLWQAISDFANTGNASTASYPPGIYGFVQITRDFIEPPGGGGAPEWVPDGAKIHIDLVRAFNEQDAAWVDGVGVVAVDTLLGSDPNTENAWGPSSYNSANLTTNGYFNGDDGATIALLVGALSSVLTGATVRLRFGSSGNAPSGDFIVASANGVDALDFVFSALGASAYSWGGPTYLDLPSVTNVGEGASNTLAVTTSGSRLEISCNGSEPQAGTLESSDRPEGNPLVAAFVSINTQSYFKSITIYDPLPSTTGLSALSAVS